MRKTNYPDAVLQRNIKKLVAEEGITQADLARICDKERKAVMRWIAGMSSPTAWDLKQICLRFGISADEMLGI